MFKGFSQQTQDFLWGIALNNEKPWFEAHKAEYEKYLKTPLRELGSDIMDRMMHRYPKKDWQIHITRIYRDARRLFGRGPYKDHLWYNLKEDGQGLMTGPTFWFYIGPAEFGYGLGIFAPEARQMERHRAMIDANPGPLERLAKELEKQSRFKLEGQTYARPKGQYPEPLSGWYNMKTLDISCRMDFGGPLFGPELVDILIDGYTYLMPYYEYFKQIGIQ